MKSKVVLFCVALLGGAFSAQAGTQVGLSLNIGVPAPIVVRQEPPRPVLEQVMAAPGPGFVWVAGHYSWMEGRWVWVRGSWVLPPQPGAFWVTGRWERHHRTWMEGHWEVPVQVVATAPMSPPPLGTTEIYVEAAPPLPQSDVISVAPAPDYVWIGGYWGWNMGRHVWIAGHWERPPHGFHGWVAPRWERRGRGYVFVRGFWR